MVKDIKIFTAKKYNKWHVSHFITLKTGIRELLDFSRKFMYTTMV